MDKRIIGFIFTGLLIVSTSCHAGPAKNVQGDAPYYCNKLTLKDSGGITHGSTRHDYLFVGKCSVRVSTKPLKYKEVWVEIEAGWNATTHTAKEAVELTGADRGEINLVMKCSDDPWISSASCELKKFSNETIFPSLSTKFSQGKNQYPPLSRGVATHKLAAALSKEFDTKKVVLPTPSIIKNKNFLKGVKRSDIMRKEKFTHRRVKPLRRSVYMRVFKDPIYRGHRVDYCLNWSKNCGVAAANKFCKISGFQRGVNFAIAEDIGHTTPTLVIGDRRVCAADYCDGFKFIRCIGRSTAKL